MRGEAWKKRVSLSLLFNPVWWSRKKLRETLLVGYETEEHVT
jgi:hypothetical protein